ncbi:MAG: ABC transporter substrate-binding protein [Treponema sp.]|jgi:NitT/TauT family transport system substrate-binding protein|nr:ABC transporter substrate-binding protein [Treponema sp.]
MFSCIKKKNNPRFFWVLALALAGFNFSCTQKTTALTVYAIKGSPGLCMLPMFEAPPQIQGFDLRLEALSQADLAAAKFISGEAKIGILPPNIAAKIAASGINIQAAAVTGEGMLSLLSLDPAIRSINDLKGKKVDAAGAGATPDYVLRRLLLNRGLEPDADVQISFALAHPEIVQSLIAGRISTALLPEPFASMALGASSSIRQIGDVQDEWEKAYGSLYPMTLFAVDGDFAASNHEAMAVILKSLEDSIQWTVSNPQAAGELAEKHGMGISAAAAVAAIPRSNYVFIPAALARPSLESLFRIFLEFSPQSIGNALPEDSFYFKASEAWQP